MDLITLAPCGFAANTYFLVSNGAAIAIDPGQPRALDFARKNGFSVTHVLLTHGHFDHIGGCAALGQAGAKIGCLAAERELILGNDNMGCAFGRPVPPFPIDFTFSDGDVLTLGGISLTVMATPGHTAGSCCFLADGALFSGDTLFARDVGRTDLPTGDERALSESLKKLAALPNVKVYPGHGAPTTIEEEKKYGCLRM